MKERITREDAILIAQKFALRVKSEVDNQQEVF